MVVEDQAVKPPEVLPVPNVLDGIKELTEHMAADGSEASRLHRLSRKSKHSSMKTTARKNTLYNSITIHDPRRLQSPTSPKNVSLTNLSKIDQKRESNLSSDFEMISQIEPYSPPKDALPYAKPTKVVTKSQLPKVMER